MGVQLDTMTGFWVRLAEAEAGQSLNLGDKLLVLIPPSSVTAYNR